MDNLKTLIQDLFADGSIGTIGEHNSNGADSYACPSCGAYKFIMGYCNFMGTMDTVDHKPDCKLQLLYKMTNQDSE